MKLECSVEEFEQLINNFQIKEENIIIEKTYIDGEKVSKLSR